MKHLIFALLALIAVDAHAYDRRTKTSTQTPTVTPTITQSFTVSPTRTPSKTASQTFTVSPTRTISATATPTATITETRTTSPTPSATPTRTQVPSDDGLVNWPDQSLSRNGGRMLANARISLGSVFLDKSSIVVPFVSATTIREGQSVALNGSGAIIATASTLDQNFVGIATNATDYIGGRVYVAVAGTVRVLAPAISVVEGGRYVCTASGLVTRTTAVADPSIYTSLSNTSYVLALETKNLSGCADCTFRGLLVKK